MRLGYSFFLLASLLCSSCGLNQASIESVPTDNVVPYVNLSLTLRAYLGGTYNTVTNKLNTTLNSGGYLPLNSPYSASPWNQPTQDSVDAGFFASNPTLCDWVMIELRTSPLQSSTVARQSGFLDEDGYLYGTDGQALLTLRGLPGSYYVVLYHRNHLPVMSATPADLSETTTASLDFTTSLASVAAAENGAPALIIRNVTRYALIGGDINHDNKVIFQAASFADPDEMLNQLLAVPGNVTASSAYALAFGYYGGDFDLNGHLLYTGGGNDPQRLRTTILAYPLNTGISPAYVISGNTSISFPLPAITTR